MSSSALGAVRKQALLLSCMPMGLVVITAFFLLVLKGIMASYSILLGGMVWLLPNAYFAVRVFAKPGTATAIMWRFYRAELTKLGLSAVLFIVVVKFVTVSMLLFLTGFIIAQLSFWFMPVLFILKK